VIQVVWIIPEELIKRVSQAQFSITICLLGGFVNHRLGSIHCGTRSDLSALNSGEIQRVIAGSNFRTRRRFSVYLPH
jgi:hypothetical protein